MSFNFCSLKQQGQIVIAHKSKQIDQNKYILMAIGVKAISDHKYLGLILHARFSIVSHINEQILKARKVLGIIKSLPGFFSVKSLDQIFKMYTRPLLDFCDAIHHIPSTATP